MRLQSTFARSACITVIAAAAAVAVPALANAKPFDSQPTPLFCTSGMAAVQTLINSESPLIPGGNVFYAINEQGGPGAMITWANVSTGQIGTAPIVPTQLVPTDPAMAPIALLETGAGTVLSAVYGSYTNAAGEMCVLVPGFTTNEVPAQVSTQPVAPE
jgi:hypothetical protein